MIALAGLPLGVGARKQALSHPAKFATVGLRAPRRIHTLGQEQSFSVLNADVRWPVADSTDRRNKLVKLLCWRFVV